MAILAYDDVMLREPRLLVPELQPLGQVRAISVAGVKKPDVCIVPSSGLICVAGSGASVSLSSKCARVADFDGIAIKNIVSAVSGQYNGMQLDGFRSAASSYTFLFRFLTGSATSFYLLDSETGRLVIGSNNDQFSYYDGAWSDWGLTANRFAANLIQTVVIVLNANTGVGTLYNDRPTGFEVLTANTYTATPIGGATRLLDRFAPGASTYTAANSGLHLFALWKEPLGDTACRSLIENPYQFLIPA